jgi:hypothetical protein
MRASDAEHEQAAQALREHYAAGRLDEQELGERLEGVYEARTVEQLERLRRELTRRDRQPARRPVSGPRRRELR